MLKISLKSPIRQAFSQQRALQRYLATYGLDVPVNTSVIFPHAKARIEGEIDADIPLFRATGALALSLQSQRYIDRNYQQVQVINILRPLFGITPILKTSSDKKKGV